MAIVTDHHVMVGHRAMVDDHAQAQRGRGACDNVWGDGKAGERIAGLLASLPTGGAVLEKVNTY